MIGREQRKREIAIGIAMAGNKNGEIVALTDGSVGTVNNLFRRARGHGFNGTPAAFAGRIRRGCRDFDKLCLPVDAVVSERIKSAKKRKDDPEFLAAIAAVDARRGKR